MSIRIGTSGWVYQHWRTVFYPPEMGQARWFGHYAATFDTVEINNSFYRLPSAAAFDAWREQAPDGFLYAVKASRYLTHMKKLKEPEEPLRIFFDRARRLRETLGPVLYQLPPRWRLDLPRFMHFLSVLPPGYRHVVEFRDQSWLAEEVFLAMERFGVTLCVHDMHPLEVPARVTAETAYVRLHGDVGNQGDYRAEVLARWARQIEGWAAVGHTVYVYFNNDPHGYALRNALTLRSMVGGESAQR